MNPHTGRKKNDALRSPWRELDERAGRFRARPAPRIEADQFLEAVLGDKGAEYARERTLAAIQREWPTIVGPLATHGWPMRIGPRGLVVRVEKSVYAQEIRMRTTHILQGIRERTGMHVKGLTTENGRIAWHNHPAYARGNKTEAGSPAESSDTNNVSPGGQALLAGLRAIPKQSG